MKGKENTDTYRCLNCGWTMPAEEQGKEPDHCPNCLLAIHEEDREGNECGGILEPGDRESDCHGRMEPIGVWVRKSGEWAVHRRVGAPGRRVGGHPPVPQMREDQFQPCGGG